MIDCVMQSIENKVIVAAFCTFNSYGILRTLSKIGIKPYLIINKRPDSPTARSAFGGPKIYFDSPDEVPDLLMCNFGKERNRPIVICCDDALQAAVDLQYDRLSPHFLLSDISRKQGAIAEMMAKELQMEVAARAGVLTPRTWICRRGTEIPEDILYPCIAKPIKSIDGSKVDIRICKTEHELREALDKRDYLVQQFIEKDYEVILWGTSIGNGEYFLSGVTRKIRQYPTEWGLSSYCVLEDFKSHPGLDKDAIIRFLKLLNYNGMFSIEMAVRNDRYYMVEINLRNDGKQHFSTVAGANLPQLYIASLLNIPVTIPHPTYPSYFMGENTDFRQIFRGKVNPVAWLRDLFRTSAFYIIDLRDPKVFLNEYFGKAISFVRRRLHI